MIVSNLNEAQAFVTKDGVHIRSIVDRTNAPVRNLSLAEATLPPGTANKGHCHLAAEEIYFFLSGRGAMTVSGESRVVGPHDAVLIPPGAYHQIANSGDQPLVFLCCCAPPYSHDDTVVD